MRMYLSVVDRNDLLVRSSALKGEAMRRRKVIALLNVAAVVVLSAACGTDGGSDPSGATTTHGPTTSVQPSADPTTTLPAEGPPVFPKNTAPQVDRSSGRSELVLTDVRVADHEGFDRIVVEFSGAGTPGWAVDYVDNAVLDGSGEPVTLDGDAFLDIYASGTTWPASDYYDGPRHVGRQQGGDVSDVYVGGTFEGDTQVLAGIDGGRVPFRVFALTEPARLVVDVADQDVG
ncbi:hypothetical protein BH09ACT12_BH09ACT12_27180 [soil metagenome]